MADTNRGRGRGRGRGDGGGFRGDFAGGGGRGGGDRGRGGGEFRGDGRGGGDRGRGGGEFRGGGRGGGDRGRGGGDFRGGGRGGGDRGRGGGDFRGGGRGGGDFRGGGRGGGDYRGRGGRGGGSQEDGPPLYKVAGGVPVPDKTVTDLENKWAKDSASASYSIEELSADVSNRGITATGSAREEILAVLPRRPAYATGGAPVVLWANYFNIKIESRTLYKYAIKVQRAGSDEEVVGKLLRTIVGKALALLIDQNPDNRIVSEFKAKVVSQGELKLPPGFLLVKHAGSGRRQEEEYNVTFSPAELVEIDKLVQWLTTMNNRLDEINPTFPKFAATIDAIGVIMGHHARTSVGVVPLGATNARFFPSDDNTLEKAPLSAMKNIVRGYFSSARPATGRLLLNVNVTHAIFQTSGNAMELIKALLNECRVNLKDLKSPALRAASRKISKVKFEVTIFNSKGAVFGISERSILELSRTTAKETSFKLEAPKDATTPDTWANGTPVQYGQSITVEQYYLKKFNKSVNTMLPLIVCGTSRRKIHYPSEFCRILPNQCSTGKLNGMESSAMINFACRGPADNARSITGVGAQMLGISGATNEILKAFGITVLPGLITVQGRVLPSPVLTYLDQNNRPKNVPGTNGSWNLRDVKVLRAGTVASWGCLTIIDNNDRYGSVSFEDVKFVMGSFASFLNKNMGIKIPLATATTQIKVCRDYEGDEYRVIKEGLKSFSPMPQMIFVILPDSKDATVYSTIKRIADIELGVHTVCMVKKNLMKKAYGDPSPQANPQYYANVGLKVNLKGGGINHRLSQEIPLIKGGKTMVVGWDVLHPTNLGVDRKSGLPSVVGLVSSVDEHLAQWPAVAWAQKGRQEMADGRLEDRFKSRLQLWQKHNQNRLPDNILIFRDGVSEGDFANVENIELPLVRSACTAVYGKMKRPKISIIVSVKRHHTRFFPTEDKDMSRSMNSKSGTVVDRGVTVARYWDFFLQSHDALKGTARPARYTVIHNEIFPSVKGANAADELEKLTHSMSFLFGRATKAVSICPPAYYADIVCTRHRAHLAEIFDSVISGAGSVVSGQTGLSASSGNEQQILARADALTVHPNLAESMYWI